MKQFKKTVSELAEKVGAEIKGDPRRVITGVASLEEAKEGQISFFHISDLNKSKYLKQLPLTKASVVILSREFLANCPCDALIVDDPYFAYAMIAGEFEDVTCLPSGVHSTAVIGENCKVDPTASIGAHVVIENDVTIGAHTQIRPGCVIGEGAKIGDDCLFWANVTIYHGVQIGHRVILHSGAVIGADGFGIAMHQGRWHKIPQLGTVIIHDDVEVGANTTIDRGALGNTIIGRGVKLDNLIQIGHNTQVGDHTVMAGCSGVAGSSKIGKYCMFGARAGMGGHMEIADHVILGATAMVTKSIHEPGLYASGTGYFKHRDWMRNIARLRHLDDIVHRLMILEKKVLKKGDNDE